MSLEADPTTKTLGRSTAFEVLADAVHIAANSKQQLREAREAFIAEAEANIGRRATFEGRPAGYVKTTVRDNGERFSTMVPCYSLADEVRKPLAYKEVTVAGTEDNSLMVRYETWGEDYELVPVATITDFSWAEVPPEEAPVV